MKRIYFLMLVAVILISACQTKAPTKSVDLTAIKENVNALMDKSRNAYITKDVNASLALLTEDGLFLGTDPSEYWNKKTLSDMWTQMMADTNYDFHYSVDKREIRVAPDGNSAIVIEQYTMTSISPKIPIRSISHVIKAGNNWMIDFSDWAFIPKNEDIAKLNKALE